MIVRTWKLEYYIVLQVTRIVSRLFMILWVRRCFPYFNDSPLQIEKMNSNDNVEDCKWSMNKCCVKYQKKVFGDIKMHALVFDNC